jgi:hypothetical protein
MGIRRQLVVAAGAAVVAAAAVTGGYLWQARKAPAVRAGQSISLHSGKVAFRAPAGWTRQGCPSGDTVNCVLLLPPGADPAVAERGDSIFAIVSTPDPKAPEGDLSLLLLDPSLGLAPGTTYFTRDGVRFVRTHVDAGGPLAPGPPSTMVMGLLPNQDKVMLSCTEKTDPSFVRAACDVVADSLRISS